MRTDAGTIPRPTPSDFAIVVVGLAGAAAGPPALARLDAGIAREHAGILVACTGLLCAALARSVLRSRTTLGALMGAIGGGALYGALNGGFVMFMLGLKAGHLGAALAGLLAGSILGAPIGAPLGAAFGAVFAPILAAAVRARLRPSHDAFEPALLAAAFVLAVIGVFVAWNTTIAFRSIGAVLATLGVLFAMTCCARDVARLRCLLSLRAGTKTRFRIVARDRVMSGFALPALFVSADADATEVLVAIDRQRMAVPFRSLDDSTPIARVTPGARRERTLAAGRIGAALAVATAAAQCLVCIGRMNPPREWNRTGASLFSPWE